MKRHDRQVTALVLTLLKIYVAEAPRTRSATRNSYTQQHCENRNTSAVDILTLPDKVLLRSMCSHCALYVLVAIKALPLDFAIYE